MDVQLKELIDKIKNDGVKSAEENATRIILEAEEKAAAIILQAEKKSDSIRETAKADAEKSERSGREALRQAGRDLVLTVKSEIESIFGKVLETEIGKALESDLLASVITAAVNSLADSDKNGIEVLVSQKNLSQVETGLISSLGSEIASGLEIKPFKGIDAGFRISMKDGSAFYDFSEKEIAALLGRYLNPRLSKLLSE
jgi:V/A-type H+-transporting ATPase subunit E